VKEHAVRDAISAEQRTAFIHLHRLCFITADRKLSITADRKLSQSTLRALYPYKLYTKPAFYSRTALKLSFCL